MSGYYEPHPRYLHSGALVQKKWFNYGGKIHCEYDNDFDVSVIEEYDPFNQCWKAHKTSGEPPLGYMGSAASSIGSKLYIFGGRCEKQYYNTLHELDVNELTWKILKPENNDGVCPIPKYGAGMISFDNRLLVTYGGIGCSPASYKEHALYVGDRRSSVENVWTNELLYFDINEKKWHIPPISQEERPTACAGCSFTKVDYYRAVIFGGYGYGNICVPDYVRILDMSQETWKWEVVKPNRNVKWPEVRTAHSAMSLCETGPLAPRDDPELLVIFGRNNKFENLKDTWIYNLENKRWKKGIFCEDLVTNSAASVRNSTCLLHHYPGTNKKTLVQFGGIISERKTKNPFPGTTLIDLEIGPMGDLIASHARFLKSLWLSVTNEYPQFTCLGEEKKEIFTPDDEPQYKKLDDSGISIRILRTNSVETNKDVKISVQPCVGDIEIQEKCSIHSPVYMLKDSDGRVKRSAIIQIEHTLNLENEEDCRNMTFLRGSRKGEAQSLYEFIPYSGASQIFEVGKNYGEITIDDNIAPLCIASRDSGKGVTASTRYSLQIYSTPPACKDHFAVLTLCLMQREYIKGRADLMKQHHPELKLHSSCEPVYLKGQEMEICCSMGVGWKVITRKIPMIIYKEEADLPEDIGMKLEDGIEYPPRINLGFTPEDQCKIDGNCTITVKGTTKDIEFNLCFTVNRPEENIEDFPLPVLVRLLEPCATKWKQIGVDLGFSVGILDNIEKTIPLALEGPVGYLGRVIQKWFDRESSDSTIDTLCQVLEGEYVDEPVLADNLRQNVQNIVAQNIDQVLKQSHPDYESAINSGVENLRKTGTYWEENDVINKSLEVGSLVNDIVAILKFPSELCTKTEEIKNCCKEVEKLVMDVVTDAQKYTSLNLHNIKEDIDKMVTTSEILQKQAKLQHSLQLKYLSNVDEDRRLVSTVGKLINSLVDLPDALKKVLEATDTLVKQMPPSSVHKNQWKPRERNIRSNTVDCNGNVGTLKRKLESSIRICRPPSRSQSMSYTPRSEYKDPPQRPSSVAIPDTLFFDRDHYADD